MRKNGSLKKKRMKEEEKEEGGCRSLAPKVFFFEILSDLNQAVPNHFADESQRAKRAQKSIADDAPSPAPPHLSTGPKFLDLFLHIRLEIKFWTQWAPSIKLESVESCALNRFMAVR